jgi:hypothetical protein
MKYRITEHKDGNDSAYYTVEILKKGLLWGESWQIVSTCSHPKFRKTTSFETLQAAREYINTQTVTRTVIEEGNA